MDAAAQLTAALAGRYEIDREIGRGGMATVYLARDLKHDRKVAVKLLNPELGAVLGPDRFLSEIRVTANLQHPNLLALFDSGETAGLLFYVMPFIDGESLRARLDREKQLPVDEAVRIAVAVAGALDYAHGHGVIHRDLKPENILLQHGQPVVADFGIALAVSNAGGARVTQTGLSLGTPQYMSPEQATGDRAIDGRTDIYSLGAVLYEMLAGEPPHSGTSAQAIIAKLMTTAPQPVRSLRPAVPPNVAMAVEKALAKLPADRFGSAKEFAEALTNPAFTLSTFSAAVDQPRWPRRGVEIALALLSACLLAAALWGWLRPAPPKQVVRYTLDFDSTEALSPGATWGRIALSSDGSKMVYVGGPKNQLMFRRRNELHAKPIAGTEGASTPFFSPNGDRVGFVTAGNVLKIVALNGSPPIVVTDSLVGPAGFSWARDGFIYGDGLGANPLVRVAAKAAAVPAWFTVLDTAAGETDEILPDVLPNGKALLFTAMLGPRGDQAHDVVELADVATGVHHVLLDNAFFARYCESGHLLYVTSAGNLMVAPFDLAAQKITGDPLIVAEGLRAGIGGGDVAVSKSGTLVYVAHGGSGANRELVWVTRDGKAQPVDPSWRGSFESPSLSPDGTRLAIEVLGLSGPPSADIWIKHLDAGPAAKLTLEGGLNRYPAWSPDGRTVFYELRYSGSASALLSKPADGGEHAVTHLRMRQIIVAPHQSPDGKWLVFQKGVGATADIAGVRTGVDSAPVPLVASKYAERAPALSPDGRWLAYTSNETGRSEVYVVPFPNTSASRWMVSTRGGIEPTWSHRGTELFYRDSDGFLVSVSVNTTPTFSVGRATPLFPAGEYFSGPDGIPQYAVSTDDKRFLFIRSAGGQSREQVTVVENWFEELKARK